MAERQIGVTSPERMRRIWDATLRVEQMRTRQPQDYVVNLPAPLVFRNDSGHEIPPYGCCQVIGTEEIGNQNYLLAGRPIDWTGAVVGPFFFNSPWAVADGDYGNFQPGPIYRAIGDGTTLSIGMRIGPVDASFDVGKGCLYSVLGDDDVATDCLRLVDCTTSLMAITDGSGIPAGGSGTVTVRIPSSTTWSGGTVTYTAHNDALTGIGASKRVILFPLDAKWMAVEVC